MTGIGGYDSPNLLPAVRYCMTIQAMISADDAWALNSREALQRQGLWEKALDGLPILRELDSIHVLHPTWLIYPILREAMEA